MTVPEGLRDGDPLPDAGTACRSRPFRREGFGLTCHCCGAPGLRRIAALTAHVTSPPRSLRPAPSSAALVLAPDGGVLVNTVLGPVSSRALGMTLSHEHVYVSSAGMSQVYPERLPLDYIVPESVAALQAFKASGGGAIVDCTTYDLGRDVGVMRRVSEESGVHIIPVTGSWIDPPRSLHHLTADDLAALYIREAMVGIEGTDIKAGLIKCAHESGTTWRRGKGFTPVGELTCRAAARAQRATGLPITTHTEVEERVGLAQIGIFEEEGVDLNRVYIGHCNDATDVSYLTAMLEKGVWLGLDRTGPGPKEGDRPDWKGRTETVKHLIDAGYGHRIMLSHDWMVYLGFIGNDHAKELRKLNPDGYCFILRNVIPKLRDMAVSEEQINAILYDNPRRFLENAK